VVELDGSAHDNQNGYAAGVTLGFCGNIVLRPGGHEFGILEGAVKSHRGDIKSFYRDTPFI
jgi:hypothetical protein